MKRIIPILIITIFFISGFTAIGSNTQISSEITHTIDVYQHSIINQNKVLENPSIETVSYQNPAATNEEYQQQITLFESQKETSLVPSWNFVIITTANLYPAVISSSFIGWKELVGYSIRIVNISDSEITSQTGDDLPEKIRNFLRANYQSWGIEFVLIVGNHATIPMRYCFPDPNNHRFDVFDYTSGEVPTDYYYADLSNSDADSWDYDDDGYFGEYGQDQPDFYPEVYVGRIPTNNLGHITYTLNKIVTFEQDTSAWKQHALHAGAFFYFTNENHGGNPAMDGAKLSYYVEQDIMTGWNITHFSEQEGLEKSVYVWPPLSHTSFIDTWRTGKHVIVNWQGHGWTNQVARKVWAWDDGDNVPEAAEISWPSFITSGSSLDDDYPSVVTAESCYVGCPEPAPGGNLGIELLTDPSMGASIGVVASARSPYGSYDWPTSPGGSDSIIYEFNRFMINDSKRVGEALYDSKYFCNYNYGWNSWIENLDMYTFNLYGDPSLQIAGISVSNHPPDVPQITGPHTGKPGVEHTYCIVASDSDNDSLYVQWNWDDGTTSDWFGPLNSGTEICESHTWDTKGTYQVSVTVQDEGGLQTTGYKEVSMPRVKPKFLFMQLFFERIQQWFPGIIKLLF